MNILETPKNATNPHFPAGDGRVFWLTISTAILLFHLGLFVIPKIYGYFFSSIPQLRTTLIKTALTFSFEAALSFILLKYSGIRFKEAYRMFFGAEISGREMVIGAASGIMLFTFAGILFRISALGFTGIQEMSVYFKDMDVYTFLGRILTHLAKPIGEEMFFRGFIFTLLATRMQTLKALIASSLIFSLSHINYLNFSFSTEALRIVIFFLNASVYCALFTKHKNLISAFCSHSAYNILTSLFYIK